MTIATATRTAPKTAAAILTDLRREYARMRDAGRYEAGGAWDEAVADLLLPNASPAEYVGAAAEATTICNRCHGTGTYAWGGTVNGKPVHTGDCFRCEGKGVQDQDDYRRCIAYDRHAIRRACGF